MNAVSNSTAASQVASGVVGSPAPAAATSTLLPPPPAADVDVGDAVTKLLEMSSQLSEQQMQLGRSQAEVADGQRSLAAERRKEAFARAVEAARKAREAQEDAGGLFSFVTDNIGLTGLVGLATFNIGLVAADITAHKTELAGDTTNFLDVGAAVFGGPLAYLASQGVKNLAPEGLGQTSVAAALLGGPMGYALERGLEKMVPDDFEKSVEKLMTVKDDDVRMANKVALTIAMAAVAATCTVLSGGTSAPAVVALVGIGISTGTQVAAQTGALEDVLGEKAAMYVALGGAITGAALTLGGSVWSAIAPVHAATKLGSVARVVSGAQSVLEGTSSVVAGLSQLEHAKYQRAADMANTDAEAQRHVLQRIERVINDILEDLKEAKESAQRATETVQATLQVNNQTILEAGLIKV